MNYYVVLRRSFTGSICNDIVSIYDEAEATRRGWIDEKGNRKWIVPSQKEICPSFVWKFSDFDKASNFYETLIGSELGIECLEL